MLEENTKIKTILNSFLNAIYDIIFPIYCQSCGNDGKYLCDFCLTQIYEPEMQCPICEIPSPLGQTHQSCYKKNQPINGVMIASPYKNPAIKNLIWNYKYNFAHTISPTLATILTDFVVKQKLEDYLREFTVCPVPLHKNRERLRGFNQSELIAKQLAENLGWNFQNLLKRVKNTKRQVDLEKNERVANLKNAFEPLKNDIPNKVLLIDDIATTNITLIECSKVLKKHGADIVWGLVIAKNRN